MSSSQPSTPLRSKHASPCLPERVINITLPDGITLVENGKGKTIAKDSDERKALREVFPDMTGCMWSHSYFVVQLKTLPDKPWPTFVSGHPLYLTTNMMKPMFERGRITIGPELTVDGQVRENRNPSTKTFINLLKTINEAVAEFTKEKHAIHALSWNGRIFTARGKNEPSKGWQDKLPRTMNGFQIEYMWAKPRFDEYAVDEMYEPAPGRRDDHEYIRENSKQLRPGVILGGYQRNPANNLLGPHYALTTSGMCVVDKKGNKYVTVANHGFAGGLGCKVYQPWPSRTRTGEIDDRYEMGTLIKEVGPKSDIVLCRLNPGLKYAGETFRHPAYLNDIQPFTGIADGEDITYGADQAYNVSFNSPFIGVCMGIIDSTCMHIHPELLAKHPDEPEKHTLQSMFTYWGNGITEFDEGICGSVLWDNHWRAIAQFRYGYSGGGHNGLAFCPTFRPLIEEGYKLSEIK